MAVVSGTYLKYDAAGLREDLADVIYNISPSDTPFMSSCGKAKASGTLFEWQVDSLASAVTTNAQLEGDDASYSTPAATSRVGNYCQISRKTLALSGTLEAVDKAGRKRELAYQIAKRGKELKLDLEKNALDNIGGDAGGAGTARKTATMGAWIKTNDSVGASGESPTYTAGVPAAARTDGTGRAFTETIAKAVHLLCFQSGANPSVLMVGPVNKQKVSAFSGVSTRNYDSAKLAPTAIIGAADVYVGDFGLLRVVPNRNQRERDAWFIDFDMIDFAYLRPFHVEDMAKTGDAEKKLMLVEWGLKVKNEAGIGLAADLTTTA